MKANPTLVNFILSHQSSLIQTDFVKELWMIPERMSASQLLSSGDHPVFQIDTLSPLYPGKLFICNGMFYAVVTFERTDDRSGRFKRYRVTAEETGIKFDNNESTPLCTPQDIFTLKAGDIANYPEGPDTETTLGRFISNYLFLAYPFYNVIPYLNEEFSASKLEKRIAIPLLDGRITTEQVKTKYINTLSLFGQSAEIVSPNISEKTITIPQSIHDLRARLVEQNKAALEAGDASVMSSIEKQLIAAYKEYLKGDSSLHFLLKKKYFDVTLKKLFLTQGMTEIFGSPGKFTFIDNPMGNGWKQKDLPAIFNEVRSGSYSRAVETANGGVIAKLILRVLQDTRIATDDCGTTRGEHVHATADNLKDFIWNYVVESDGTQRLITDDNVTTFVGKDIVIRTPGYCQTTQGFCAKCFGYLFETLGQKAFAPVANAFATQVTVSSLKKMHGVSHSTADVSDINRYLVGG